MEFSVMMGILMEGFALTAEIFLITLVGSLPLGVVVALARMSKFKPLAWLAQLYISILMLNHGQHLINLCHALVDLGNALFDFRAIGSQFRLRRI